MKRIVYILSALFVLLGLYYGLRPKQIEPEGMPSPVVPQVDENAEAAQRVVAVPPETPPDVRLNRLSDRRVEFKPAVETSMRILPENTPEDNLGEIEAILSHYRFAYGENPVGVENFEFTAQLRGKNPKGIIFIGNDSPALAGNQLVDQWGTPYFFHPLSGQEMELLSAGPDRTLWTADDVSTHNNLVED